MNVVIAVPFADGMKGPLGQKPSYSSVWGDNLETRLWEIANTFFRSKCLKENIKKIVVPYENNFQ